MGQIEKMTQLKPCHTGSSHARVFEGVDQGFHDSHGLAIDPYSRVQFNGLNTAWQSRHIAVAHGRVPFSKSCILHGKGYLGRKKANPKPI